jgi:CheY-like chemotaxis protein
MVPGMRTRLLYVEDHDDLRELIAQALGDAGYDVTSVGTAEEAVQELQDGAFDVLLTDYNLPGKDGAWLLARAHDGGHLETTAAVMLTSEREPRAVGDTRILRKPVDLGVLLDALAGAVAALAPAGGRDAPAAADAEVQLVLYVTGSSQESQKAMRNLHRVLSSFDAARIHLSVVDVTSIDEAASEQLEEDRVIVTPTLVKRAPLPRTWIVGSLVRTEPVREMLALALGDPPPSSSTI